MKAKNNNNYDFTVVLPEAQEKLNRQFNSVTKLQDFAKSMFGVSSIAMSLFSTIISIQEGWFSSTVNIILFILTIIIYTMLTFFNVKSILPVSLKHALKPTWEIYSKVAYKNSAEGSNAMLVFQYLEVIKDNENILIEQYERSKCICTMLAILMFLIFLQSVMFSIT